MAAEHHPTHRSPLTTPYPTQADLQRITDATRAAAHRTVVSLARALGAPLIAEESARDGTGHGTDVEPLAGMRAARQIECVSTQMTVGYIRMARQEGHSWHDIGCALNMMQGSLTGNMHESIAETAFSYASGYEPHISIFDSHVTWECSACDSTIKDHGPNNDPIVSEQGHAGHCARHAEAIAAWTADREALNADWEAEAGQ